jgi:molybdopterin converting factor subunit 1
MKVKVKFFAILRERVGAGEITSELREGSTVESLWKIIRSTYPALEKADVRLLYAVNKSYVPGDHVLHDGDEVVFIPPVSGG